MERHRPRRDAEHRVGGRITLVQKSLRGRGRRGRSAERNEQDDEESKDPAMDGSGANDVSFRGTRNLAHDRVWRQNDEISRTLGMTLIAGDRARFVIPSAWHHWEGEGDPKSWPAGEGARLAVPLSGHGATRSRFTTREPPLYVRARPGPANATAPRMTPRTPATMPTIASVRAVAASAWAAAAAACACAGSAEDGGFHRRQRLYAVERIRAYVALSSTAASSILPVM